MGVATTPGIIATPIYRNIEINQPSPILWVEVITTAPPERLDRYAINMLH